MQYIAIKFFSKKYLLFYVSVIKAIKVNFDAWVVECMSFFSNTTFHQYNFWDHSSIFSTYLFALINYLLAMLNKLFIEHWGHLHILTKITSMQRVGLESPWLCSKRFSSRQKELSKNIVRCHLLKSWLVSY